jgi:hypothetical protein
VIGACVCVTVRVLRLTILIVDAQLEQTAFITPHRKIIVYHTKGIVISESHDGCFSVGCFLSDIVASYLDGLFALDGLRLEEMNNYVSVVAALTRARSAGR